MKRGEIWTLAGGADYAGKPRPVVIVQNDRFDATQSITVCPFTTNPISAPLFRLPIEPTQENGLRRTCQMMADKVMTVPRKKLGVRVGRLCSSLHVNATPTARESPAAPRRRQRSLT